MLTITKPPSYAVDSPAVFHISQDPAWDHERIEAERDALALAAASKLLGCEPGEVAERIRVRQDPSDIREAQRAARARHPVSRWLGGAVRFSAEATLDVPAELEATPTAVTIGSYLVGTPTGFALRPLRHAQALRLNEMVRGEWDKHEWVGFAVRWGLVGVEHLEGDFRLERGEDGALDEASIDGLDRVAGLLYELALAVVNLTNRRHDPREGKR